MDLNAGNTPSAPQDAGTYDNNAFGTDAGGGGADDGLEFVLEMGDEGAAPGQQAPGAAAVAQGAPFGSGTNAPPAPYTPTPREIELEQRLNTTASQLQNFQRNFQPIIDQYQQHQRQQATQPPVDIERLRRGEGTADDLIRYNQWHIQQQLADVRNVAAMEARAAASEADARGRFSAEAMGGANFSFDHIMQNYIQPAYAQNPALRAAVAQITPDSPAVGEFFVGLFTHLIAQNGGDYVKAAKSILYPQQAQSNTVTKIAAAQNSSARNVIRSNGARTTRISNDEQGAAAIAGMTEDQFRRFDQKVSQGY